MKEKKTMKILTRYLRLKKIKSNVFFSKTTLKNIFSVFGTLSITGVVIATFSHFMVDLFGVSIPNVFLPIFKDIGAWMILGIAFVFAISWFLKARPHKKPKSYNIVCFDVYGKETVMPGIRTEFKNHDVAWSFMKKYKDDYPLSNFALVSELKQDKKKVIFRYI